MSQEFEMMKYKSRRELYAAGEPFGECATRRKIGGGYVCGGGGGGGSSSSSSSTTTNNNDKRQAVGDGGLGVTGDGNAIAITSTTNITDGGIVKRALDSVDVWNATNAEGFSQLLETGESTFSKLLTTADKLFERSEKTIEQSNQRIAEAYNKAATDGQGTIDNKTIIVLAVAGAAALAFVNRK